MSNEKKILNTAMGANSLNAVTIGDYIEAASASNRPSSYRDIMLDCFTGHPDAWEEIEAVLAANGFIDYDDEDYADEDAGELITELVAVRYGITN